MAEMNVITALFVSFSIGVFFGALWMFYIMDRLQRNINKELDCKTKQLNSYLNKYVDDGYEAY